MMSVIKTAIITIVISIISGLLLEHFKNLAPRILCSIGNGVPVEINGKKVYAYIITVSNLSKKIIHELTLNIHSSQSNLKAADAKITKGLKFYSSIKDDILDIDIPFLSKGDKFSVTVYVENQYGLCNKPIIVMRSPENFKKVDSVEKKGILSLCNIAKINRNKKTSQNKKAMIVIVSIALSMIAGVLVKFYFKGEFTNTKIPSVKTNVNKQSNDATRSSASETNKNTGVKAQTGGTAGNTGSKTSTGETTKNIDTKASTRGTTKNTDAKESTGGTTENTDAKESTGGTAENTDTKASTGETTENTDEKTKSTDTNTSTGGTTGNTNEKTSPDGTIGNAGN